MSIEEIKIHNCKNNTTIFNTDDWIKNDDFIKFANSQQQKIDQLEREIEYQDKLINALNKLAIDRGIENQQLKEMNKELKDGLKNMFCNQPCECHKCDQLRELLKTK